MSFIVNSSSPMTAPMERIFTVLQRTRLGDGGPNKRLIAYAGCFVCKKIVGSNSWSQHSWGNAGDLFPTEGDTQRKLRHIADGVVYQATHRTKANRFRKLPVAEVIDHDAGRIWTPEEKWHAYGGTKGAHVHVSASPLKTGRPPCAS